jgi:hypothetical protein
VPPSATEARFGRDRLPHRGIDPSVAHADNTLMLALLAAAALLGSNPAISGTLSANTGSSLTVSSNDRSLTCAVLGAKGQAAILRWGTGVRASMECRRQGDRLVLTRLTRLGSKERGGPPSGTTTATEPTTTRTEPTTTTKPTPPPPVLTVGGTVVTLTGDGVSLKPDRGGELVKCAITPASDSQKARASLAVGAHVGIACRQDGGRYVLAAAMPIS